MSNFKENDRIETIKLNYFVTSIKHYVSHVMNLKLKHMYQAVEIIIPLASFALIFGIVYVAITAKHREKMAMIEAGMNPNEKENSKHSKIRTGLLFFLVPLGIFVGYLVSETYPIMRNQSLGLIFAFIFGGMGLIIAYFIERKQNENNLID